MGNQHAKPIIQENQFINLCKMWQVFLTRHLQNEKEQNFTFSLQPQRNNGHNSAKYIQLNKKLLHVPNP